MRLIASLALVFLTACSGPQVLNSLSRDSGNDAATNIVFDPDTGLRLDVYTPHAARSAATIVFFYGGRWTNGSKEEYEFVGQTLASQGFVVVIPDYRKYPEVRFPVFIEDGARAVKWVHDNIPRYGGAPDKIFVMGHSSGAHMAALLALNNEYLKAVGMSQESLRGMIGLAGPYDFMPITDPDLRDMFYPPDKFELSQPVYFVDGRNPPLFLVHGEDDVDVWPKNTRNLAKAVADAGGAVETLIYTKLPHSCAIAVLALGSGIACGKPEPSLRSEITAFVRKNAK
jgi:acetyl esterase/lipase